MTLDHSIFRSVFVEPEVDKAVLAHAKRMGGTAGTAYRLFLEAGLHQVACGVPLPAAVDITPVLRTCNIRVDIDQRLQGLAYRLRVPQAQLGMRVARLGMRAIRAALGEGEGNMVALTRLPPAS